MAKPTILCVDDEVAILDSLKTQLKHRFGDRYSYEVAEGADEALEIIAEAQEDGANVVVIVSDWLMPGVKGDEFLIRVHQQFPGIVKVMLTGQADEAAVARAREGADLHRCLHKPWDGGDLIEAIESGLALS